MKALEISDSWTRKEGGVVTHWRPMIVVDEIPGEPRDFTAVRLELGDNRYRTFFFCEQDGYVRYNVYDPSNMNGYGGREFSYFVKRYFHIDAETDQVLEHHAFDPEAKMGETTHTGWWAVKGPWSSRSGVMNKLSRTYDFLNWPMTIEASVTDADSGISYGAAVTIGWLFGEIERLDAPYYIVRKDEEFAEDEPRWEFFKEVT